MAFDASGPDALQLAEALWLAGMQPARLLGNEAGTADDERGNPNTKPPAKNGDQGAQKTDDNDGNITTKPPGSGGERPVVIGGSEQKIDVERGAATAFLSPSGRAVSDLPRLARALRPLSRRIPDPKVRVLDTNATVESFARACLQNPDARLAPKLIPGTRRAWELVLLVDHVENNPPPTHLVLGEIARELTQMLRWQGAFRVVMAPWLEQNEGEVMNPLPKHLISASHDRLFVVLTDMRTSAWASGSALLWLGKLAERAPVSVWQILPERLWRRTAVGIPRWLVRNEQPASINTTWKVRGRPGIYQPLASDTTPKGYQDIPLPITVLEPESLARWARFVTGDGRVELPAVRLRVSPLPLDKLKERMTTDPFTESEEVNTRERLIAFFDLATPEAQRLAALCAGVPITLPILRLVQQAFLPKTPPSVVSEVLMSALLAPLGNERFVWREGVAKELALRVSVPTTLEVRRRIGEFLGTPPETMARFVAQVLDSSGDTMGEVATLDDSELFAYLSAKTLQCLGMLSTPPKQKPTPPTVPPGFVRLTEAQIRQHIEGQIAGLPEQVSGSLEIFHTSKQSTWLVATNKRLFCLLDDARTRAKNRIIQWNLPLSSCTPVIANGDTRRLNFGTRRKKWLYSARLFSKPEDVELAVDRLIDTASEKKRKFDVFVTYRYVSGIRKTISNLSDLIDSRQWFLDNIEKRFKSSQVSSYIYPFSNNAGDWSDSSLAAVDACDYHIILIVAGFNWGRGCRSEIERRISMGERDRIIPIVIGSAAVPKELSDLPAIHFSELTVSLSDKQQFTQALEELYHRLGKPQPVNLTGAPLTIADYKAQMVQIPGGTFLMGGIRRDDEQPVHSVALSSFRLGRTPVTVGMWQEFCTATGKEMPKLSDYPVWRGGWEAVLDHPIVNVSWEDCQEYAAWTSGVCGIALSLPSEAQWEYAACGGLEGKEYPWGDAAPSDQLWWSKTSQRAGTASVDRRDYILENDFGLLDMSGNVWEWCSDWFGEEYYGSTDATNPNPMGPSSGTHKVNRGGSWDYSNEVIFRCAYRNDFTPAFRSYGIGFRLSSGP